MICYEATLEQIVERVDALSPTWRERALRRTEGLIALGRYAESSSIWSEIKPVYMALQHNKCAYCEQRLEGGRKGTIAHDLEHFRPKGSVRAWPEQPNHYQFPTGDASTVGYFRLAYHLGNYLTACKVCNSQYKSDFFPIAAVRVAGGTNPVDYASEGAYLIYPIGAGDADPEDLILFDGVEAKPRYGDGLRWQRARVLIDFFELNRQELQEDRAWWLLAAWFAFRKAADGDSLAQQHLTRLTSPRAAHTNCIRQFVNLCHDAPNEARQVAELSGELIERSEM